MLDWIIRKFSSIHFCLFCRFGRRFVAQMTSFYQHAKFVNAPSKQQLTAHMYGSIAGHLIFGLLQLVPLTVVPPLLNQSSLYSESILSFPDIPVISLEPLLNLVIAALVFDSLVGIVSFFCVAFLLLNNSKNIRIALVLNVIVSMTSCILNTTIVAIIFYNRYKPTLIVIGTVFYVGISLGFAYNTFRYTRRLDKFNKLAGNVAGARI